MIFENISIQLYLDGSWTSITNDVVSSNGIQLTPRIDGTFLVGTFDAWLTREYIAPYTPLKITINGYVFYLVCSSTSSKYLFEENKYYHTFDIFEATALLSNFIVGSKSFSVTGTNKSDNAKINILIELMQNKYGLTITNHIVGLGDEREFIFGAGTTFYDALSEILADYDLIPIVTEITSATEFKIDVLNKNDYNGIDYLNNEITSVVNKQSMDNYCKYLETEASNVVDRTTNTTWKDLTVRAEDILIDSDKAVLLLPSKVEEITSIKTDGGLWGFNVDLDPIIYANKAALIPNYTDGVASIGTINKRFDLIFYYFANFSLSPEDDEESTARIIQEAKEETSLYKLLHKLFYDADGVNYTYSQLCSKLDSITWTAEIINDNETLFYRISSSYTYLNANSPYSATLDIPVNDIEKGYGLLEKAKWDTLDVTEKPKYMYYESGTNVIKGLYDFYKDDFWGQITGGTVTPWYTHVKNVEFNETLPSDNSTGYAQKGLPATYNPMNAVFSVTATPIVDPMIINQKSINPLNESVWKPYARSYNQKASTIEFDKLEERIQISNNSLGDVELEIEMTNPSFIPNLIDTVAYKMTYKNVEYYVMAFVINIKLDMVTINYSLSRTYSKKAEVIGVDTQFEATPNPLKNIITRPIYINGNLGLNLNLDEFNYLHFTFKDANGQTIANLLKRYSVLHNGNTKLLYCEMIDQYTFDYSMVYRRNDGTKNIYYRNPVPYVDSNNEAYSVTISLVKAITDDVESFSKKLPEILGNTSIVHYYLTMNTILYKDAREHLTFTIKLN